MARYRAGYDHDTGLRGFDNHRVRTDVGSHGYDHGYRLFQDGSSQYRRPWVGGYYEGYQGGSEGIAMNTGASGSAYIRGEGAPWRAGYDRDYRSGREYRSDSRGGGGYGMGNPGRVDRGDQGYMGGGGEYSPHYLRGTSGGYDQGFRGGYQGFGFGGGNRGGGQRYGRGQGGYDNGYRRGYDGGYGNGWNRQF
ncbi:MAG: hypothetical protein JO040_07745 [Gemmatimonadetes bacterium]|nr:hypothetical protein [Gemmatimonadota bacterium]